MWKVTRHIVVVRDLKSHLSVTELVLLKSVLVTLLIAVAKDLTKATHGRKDLLHSQFTIRSNKGRNSNREGTWMQELMKSLWRGVVY